ncbi:hypothetical protein BGW36DRAFT_348173 [Talaromyces proteolyticus]|uniref:Uncharacterized protein n=1 Tax=Talaromyces proteolyticus TaxID=1131652 RepID=A0AAD4KH72_9EURO|nr:uncharacterized protein BGW36DRAFT_348173 [Talaromyces proteolyticus]KAH8692074.1 hypothetical protein BGW36DRAFT_348173 [Talaromyces proteolyticus]
MEFKPRFPTLAKTSPKSLINQGSPIVILRDQFTISTWLLLGASVNVALSLLLPQSSIYIGGLMLSVLGFRVGLALLQTFGILHNPGMDKVVLGKVSPQIPDVYGHLPTEPSQERVVVLLVGFRSNHPLGALAPGFKETTNGFSEMLKVLDGPEGRQKYGFLGMSSYMGMESSAANEIISISYWRNIEAIHEFAYSPVHKEVWDWWNRTEKKHDHIAIMHEIYRAEGRQGAHEAVYVNSKPTLLGGTAYPTKEKTEEKEDELVWRSPLVEARRGVLASGKGRLGQLKRS